MIGVIGISIVAAQFAASNTLRMHIHPELTITSNSTGAVTIPAQIGIEAGLWEDPSLDQYGVEDLSPLHTHGTSGLIHVESNTVRDFTLREFLAIWGQPSDGSVINGKQFVSLTVDGQGQSRTQDVILKDKQKIVMTTN